jgi:hypothetical protein
MLKTASSFVLSSSKSSTYPRGYASGFDSPAALLEDRFDHPAGLGPKAVQTLILSRHTPCGLAWDKARLGAPGLGG